MIKRFVFFLLVSLYATILCAQPKTDAFLMGHVKNPKSDFIEFKYLNNPLDDSLQIFRLTIDERGTFYRTLPIQRPLDLIMTYNNISYPIYIEPGEQIKIYFYEKKDDYMYVVSDYKNNDYLIEFNKKFTPNKITALRKFHTLNDTPDKYKQFEDSLCKAKLDFLEEFSTTKFLSNTFKRRQKASYVYGASNEKFNYPNNYQFLTNKKKNLDLNYYDFMMNLSVRENDLISVAEFFDYLSNYYTYRYNTESVSLNTEKELISFEYHLAETLYEDKIKSIFLTKKFAEIIESHPYDLTKGYVSSFMSEIYSNEYRSYIDRKIAEALKGSSETKAYNFNLLDQNGNPVQLADFTGKNVYLNFWASWCLPCIAEINNHNEIQRTYNNKNFITIMISVDEDINAWKKALSNYDKNIIQLNVKGMENEVVEKYNVKSIPKSFMINKDGIIIHSTVPSPTNINVHKYLLFD